jgi:hypothetical protein
MESVTASTGLFETAEEFPVLESQKKTYKRHAVTKHANTTDRPRLLHAVPSAAHPCNHGHRCWRRQAAATVNKDLHPRHASHQPRRRLRRPQDNCAAVDDASITRQNAAAFIDRAYTNESSSDRPWTTPDGRLIDRNSGGQWGPRQRIGCRVADSGAGCGGGIDGRRCRGRRRRICSPKPSSTVYKPRPCLPASQSVGRICHLRPMRRRRRRLHAGGE